MSFRSRPFAWLVSLAFLPALAGCSALSALNSASQPLDIYELRTPSIDIRARRGTAELVVEEPVASGALSTERIMVRTGPFEAQYLPGVRWADPVPAMLQTLLVRSLGETGALGSVGRAPVGARPDFALLGELTDFQAEITEDKSAAVVRVRMMVRIVHDEESRVVASRIFEAAMPADSTETLALVAAFDRATTGLVADIVPWVLSQVR